MGQLGDYGRGNVNTLPIDRRYLMNRPRLSRGRPGPRQVMIYPGVIDQLGFSLKPPKWLRKAQPGKILKKAAIPLAVVGATLLIPGAGGVIASAALAAAKGAAKLGKGAVKLVSPTVVSTAKQAGTQAATTFVAPMFPAPSAIGPNAPGANIVSATPAGGGFYGPPMPTSIEPPAGATAAEPAGVGGMPGWLLPAAIAGGLLLVTLRAGRPAKAA
jgi:hypothetical protein